MRSKMKKTLLTKIITPILATALAIGGCAGKVTPQDSLKKLYAQNFDYSEVQDNNEFISEYDSQGNSTRLIFTSDSSSPNDSDENYIFEYDAEGNSIRSAVKRDYDGDKIADEISIVEYDAQGNVLREIEETPQGTTIAESKWYYKLTEKTPWFCRAPYNHPANERTCSFYKLPSQ